jgi:hypothetical protein
VGNAHRIRVLVGNGFGGQCSPDKGFGGQWFWWAMPTLLKIFQISFMIPIVLSEITNQLGVILF